jgi:hypothetical protein
LVSSSSFYCGSGFSNLRFQTFSILSTFSEQKRNQRYISDRFWMLSLVSASSSALLS